MTTPGTPDPGTQMYGNDADILTPAPLAGTDQWWTKLLQFVLTVAGGGTGKVKIPVGIQLPDFEITDTINVFGTNLLVTISGKGENLILKAGPA